jgi:hypothetical protein
MQRLSSQLYSNLSTGLGNQPTAIRDPWFEAVRSWGSSLRQYFLDRQENDKSRRKEGYEVKDSEGHEMYVCQAGKQFIPRMQRECSPEQGSIF